MPEKYHSWKEGEPVNRCNQDVVVHPELREHSGKMLDAFIGGFGFDGNKEKAEEARLNFYQVRKTYQSLARKLHASGECEKNGYIYLHRTIGDVEWLKLEEVYTGEELVGVMERLNGTEE